MIRKTQAIVLRLAPFSATSEVVTWLTPDQGRIVTTAKGARRPRSMFLGQYDLFYTCELLYYERGGEGAIPILREVTPLADRRAFRENWRMAMLASYVCDLVSRTAPRNEPDLELYRLLTRVLDYLATRTARPEITFWFELRLLGMLGIAPRLTYCPSCAGPIPTSRRALFSSRRGGILCPLCEHQEPNGLPVEPATAAMLRNWQNTESPRAAQNLACAEIQLQDIQHLLGHFIEYHLDTLPASRHLATRMASTSRNHSTIATLI